MKRVWPCCSTTTANMAVSDGDPRGEINPCVQVRGYRAAIDYVCSLPEIDALMPCVFSLPSSGV
jgi:hypothetical protein